MRSTKIIFGRSGRGFTILELAISAIMASSLVAIVLWLLISTAREQRVTFIEAMVLQRAALIQDRITDILREASRNNVVPFSAADVVAGQGTTPIFYTRLIFREGLNQPNQELRWDAANRRLVYDPDRNVANNEQNLDIPQSNTVETRLEYVWFAVGRLPGGAPDSSIVLVQFEVSDAGRAKSSFRNAADTAAGRTNWVRSTRNFAVNLRRL